MDDWAWVSDDARSIPVSDDHCPTPEYKKKRDEYISFMSSAFDAIPLLREVATLSPDLMKTRIPAYRDEGWVCLSATGLNMIARLGYEMLRDGEQDWREYVQKLSDVDWRRTASIWKGNVVSDDGNRILTAHKSFRDGVEALKRSIGWSSSATTEDPENSGSDEVEVAA